MKQWIILIIALILLIGGGIYETKYLESSSRYLLSDVYYSKQAIENNNLKLAKSHYNSLNDTWNNLKESWAIFIDHDEIGNLEEEMLKYNSYLEKENEEEVYVTILEIERLINHVIEKQEIHIGNIF